MAASASFQCNSEKNWRDPYPRKRGYCFPHPFDTSPVTPYFYTSPQNVVRLCYVVLLNCFVSRGASVPSFTRSVSHVRLLALIEQQQITSLSGCDVITRGLALMPTVLHFGHERLGAKVLQREECTRECLQMLHVWAGVYTRFSNCIIKLFKWNFLIWLRLL